MNQAQDDEAAKTSRQNTPGGETSPHDSTPENGNTPTMFGSEAYLERARTGWKRMSPEEAHAAATDGAVIIDLRTDAHRAVSKNIPGAIAIDRTVLEWRLDPTFSHRIPEATSWDTTYIVFCRHGYASSVAAKALQDVGLRNATDIIGGYDAWVAAGLPVTEEPADVRP